jgi:betaine reductase
MRETDMADNPLRFLHFVNQFFGQIGAEEQADHLPMVKPGPVGPGVALERSFGGKATIVATIVCGDNYVAEHPETATQDMLHLTKGYCVDGLIAGPAFNAGRYGIACGAVCRAMQEQAHIPAVTAMCPDNVAVDLYRKDVLILRTGASVAAMPCVIPKLGQFAIKVAHGEHIGFPEDEGYIPQGYKVNVWASDIGATRAIDMLVRKMRGAPFVTEVPIPTFDRVAPAPAVANLPEATIALVTSGGIVPRGNPDHIQAANADRFGKYAIAGLDNLAAGAYECVHAGYDVFYANEDPHRVVPLDALRHLEMEGAFGRLFDWYYATAGNMASVANATRFGHEIGSELKANGVDGVILTST